MLSLNQPTPQEQEKLNNIAKGICPTCHEAIMVVSVGDTAEAVCSKCPFSMPKAMYERIQQQYGKKDGK